LVRESPDREVLLADCRWSHLKHQRGNSAYRCLGSLIVCGLSFVVRAVVSASSDCRLVCPPVCCRKRRITSLWRRQLHDNGAVLSDVISTSRPLRLRQLGRQK